MKKHVSLFLAGVVVSALAVSCKKDNPVQSKPDATITNMKDMVVSKEFNFQTDHEVTYNFAMPSGVSGKYLVQIYDANPTVGGIIQSQFAESGSSLSGKVMMARGASKMYVKITSPNGSSETHDLTVSGDNIYKSFAKSSTVITKTAVVSPNCNTGCNQTISSGSYVNLDNAQTYCLTGNIQGINDNNGNAVLRVCGNVTVSGNISIKGNTELQITDGSSLTVQGLYMNDNGGKKGKITVYTTGTLTVTSNFNAHGEVVNHGTFNVNSDAYIYGKFTNNGMWEVKGGGYSTLNRNGLGDIVNNGTMKYTNGNLTENSNTVFINNCQLWVKKELKFDATVHNYSYIYTDGNFRHNNTSTVTMYNGAMLYVNGNAEGPLNGDFIGSGSTSVIKVVGGISANSPQASYSGNLEICAASYGSTSGTNLNTNNTLINGAVIACDQAYIPTSGCNPVGNGTPTVVDSDGDGVADENDAFPNDPTKSSISYYPSSNTRGTLAFEDLWPNQGDYDFNDLVIDYHFTFHKNADNKIVEIIYDYKVNAIGGSYKNGFGFQFDFPATAVQSITNQVLDGSVVSVDGSRGTENGQTKATVIAFESARSIITNGSAFVNTENGVAYVQPAGRSMVIKLSTPQTEAALGAAPYNPFIFVNATRGREVHLKNFQPTALANNSLLGSGDDASAGSNYYQNENGLPWAISISGNFDYPKEKSDIVTAYNFFAPWAMSGGSTAPNWYTSESGNRTVSNLFSF